MRRGGREETFSLEPLSMTIVVHASVGVIAYVQGERVSPV